MLSIDWARFPRDALTNIPPRLERAFVGRDLCALPEHPVGRVRARVERALGLRALSFPPVVSVESNFASLLIPPSHPSRRPSDTYYVNARHVLRTHTSAHQRELLLRGPDEWIVGGPVFRRDEVDRTHFPVFHQVGCKKTSRFLFSSFFLFFFSD